MGERIEYPTSDLGFISEIALAVVEESEEPSILDQSIMGWRTADYGGSGSLTDFSGGGRDLTVHANLVKQPNGYLQATANQGAIDALVASSLPALGSEGMTFVSCWGGITNTSLIVADASENWSVAGWLTYFGVGPSVNVDVFDGDFDPYYNAYPGGSFVATASVFSTAIRISLTSLDVLINGAVVDSTPISGGITWPLQLESSAIRLGKSIPMNGRFYGAAQFDNPLSDADVLAVATALLEGTTA